LLSFGRWHCCRTTATTAVTFPSPAQHNFVNTISPIAAHHCILNDTSCLNSIGHANHQAIQEAVPK
jgi:hypothetical protein